MKTKETGQLAADAAQARVWQEFKSQLETALLLAHNWTQLADRQLETGGRLARSVCLPVCLSVAMVVLDNRQLRALGQLFGHKNEKMLR